MQSTQAQRTAVEGKLQSTGLFIDWKKRDLLLVNVEKLLREQYNTMTFCGPYLHDGYCEILLQPLDKSGARFADAKDLLVSFLDLTKEGKPRIPDTDTKGTELIDLSEEDDTVTCIVLDDTCETMEESSSPISSLSQRRRKRKSSESIEDIVVIDSFSDNHNSHVKGNECAWSVIKEVEEISPKRKRFNNQVDTEVDVITIQDDDVIVLDSSFSVPSPEPNYERTKGSSNQSNLNITSADDNKVIPVMQCDVSSNKENKMNVTELVGSANCCKQEKRLESSSKVCSNNTEGKEENLDKSLLVQDVAGIPKTNKNSKFAYKRVPHLVHPLIHSDGKLPKLDMLSNIYNPNTNSDDKKIGLRPIIIDGNNIAISHGNGSFSLRGIQICINFFEKRGHRKIKAFLPHYRKNPETHQILNQMEKQGTVVITPSRKIDGKTYASYDDRFIVQYAAEVEGIIVSTDNYRDLLNENPKWSDTIKNRLLMFTWIDDFLMFPQDPLGRKGPSLDDFLKF